MADTQGPGQNKTASTPAPEEASLAPRVVVAADERIMATDISVQIAAPQGQEEAASVAARACMDFFREVDARLSRFKPESELSRLNRSAGEEVAVSELLFTCVALALEAARGSGGLFDPTLLRQIEALGYDRDYAQIARRESPVPDESTPATDVPKAGGGWREIVLDRERRTIRMPAGIGLDLGGIAKGWAADVAFARYCASFPGALLNLGGDLRLYGGPQPGQAWSVGIRDPRAELEPGEPNYLAMIAFSRGGLATSGAVNRWWLRDGQRRHHLLDPRTGQPIALWTSSDGQLADRQGEAGDAQAPLATVTALAPTGARAEVATKLALMRGYPACLRPVEDAWERYGALQWSAAEGEVGSPDAGVALLLAFGNGDVVLSKNMPRYLATWGTQGAALPMRVKPANVVGYQY